MRIVGGQQRRTGSRRITKTAWRKSWKYMVIVHWRRSRYFYWLNQKNYRAVIVKKKYLNRFLRSSKRLKLFCLVPFLVRDAFVTVQRLSPGRFLRYFEYQKMMLLCQKKIKESQKGWFTLSCSSNSNSCRREYVCLLGKHSAMANSSLKCNFIVPILNLSGSDWLDF